MTPRVLVVLLLVLKGEHGWCVEEAGEVEEIVQGVVIHTNVTIPCTNDLPGVSVEWRYETQWFGNVAVLGDGALFIHGVERANRGRYRCVRGAHEDTLKMIRLVVLGPPEPPQQVSVHASQVVARVTWHLQLEADYEDLPEGPKTKLNVRYRPQGREDWLSLPIRVAPSQGLLEVSKLQPNVTYELKVWTSNVYGDSDYVYQTFTTKPAIDDAEVARVMVGDVEGFSPNTWVVAVVVTLVVINVSIPTLLVLYCRQYKFTRHVDEEDIELVPHIIENPGYQHVGTVRETFLSRSPSTQGQAALV